MSLAYGLPQSVGMAGISHHLHMFKAYHTRYHQEMCMLNCERLCIQETDNFWCLIFCTYADCCCSWLLWMARVSWTLGLHSAVRQELRIMPEYATAVEPLTTILTSQKDYLLLSCCCIICMYCTSPWKNSAFSRRKGEFKIKSKYWVDYYKYWVLLPVL